MVNTVFKGDLAEVSWGKETPLRIKGDGAVTGWSAVAHASLPNTSVITLGTGTWVNDSTIVNIPDNMLVGCTLKVTSNGGNYNSDNYATKRRVYYITANDTTAGTVNVQPQIVGSGNAGAFESLLIEGRGLPTLELAMTDTSQRVKTDQFFGLLNSMSLPEPVIDVRKQHVVGMGRDVNVLTSGRETLSGGSIELNAHTLRWMKYALGGHTSIGHGQLVTATGTLAGQLHEVPPNIKVNTTGVTMGMGLIPFETSVNPFSGGQPLTGITNATPPVMVGNTNQSLTKHFLIGAKSVPFNTFNSGAVPNKADYSSTIIGDFVGTHNTIPANGKGIIRTIDPNGNTALVASTGVAQSGVRLLLSEVTQSGTITSAIVTISAPDIPLASGGVQATATATCAAGNISAITIADPGAGYTTNPTVTITPNAGSASYAFGGAGLYRTVVAKNHYTVSDLPDYAGTTAGLFALADTIDAAAPVYFLPKLTAAIVAGDAHLTTSSAVASFFTAGDYVQICDKDTVSVPGADDTLPTLNKHEIRRVVAVDSGIIYLEEAFQFDHAIDSVGIEKLQYAYNQGQLVHGCPSLDTDDITGTTNATSGLLKYGITHHIFGASHLPSFSIEQSYRQTDTTPGREQMLRYYNGCKVTRAAFMSDSEGEVKVSLEYEATRHYTDTANNHNPHRMFENTANTRANRIASGIAVNGEKPYLFQNLSIEAFGRPVIRGTQFDFEIANNNAARYYVRGYEGTVLPNDQVQHGGTHQPLEITEAQREYVFKFSAIVEDDRFWDEVRTRRHHKNSNDIVFRLNKDAGSRGENAVITLSDYTILNAKHQLPDDKGPVNTEVECAVRHLQIKEVNAYFTL